MKFSDNYMLKKLFPFTLHLQIFQLSEYDARNFLLWIRTHFFTRIIENKKKLVWTQKARLVYGLALAYAFIGIIIGIFLFHLLGFVIGLLLASQSYIFILLAFYSLYPLEQYQKNNIKIQTQKKIASLKHLKVIGITGSYGKTSVKEFLYQILRTQYSVLKTPESYNTPFGIAKVIDLELDNSYEYFICEMGAYKLGDIKEICDMVHPQFGILTGINEQHLKTFGSLENTTKTKFELIASLPKNGFGVINGDNMHIQKYLNSEANLNARLVPYGAHDPHFSFNNIHQVPEGTEFSIVLDGQSYIARTKLLGKTTVQNIVAAATLCFLLGMKPKAIIAAINNIRPVTHRLEIKELEGMTIIDDAYNSNVDGFTEAVSLLSSYKNVKILVTPGIVDLGNSTFAIHKKLGELLGSIDYIILVGKSERTKGLKASIQDKNKIIEITTITELWEKIKSLEVTHPVVLLENDLPDNY